MSPEPDADGAPETPLDNLGELAARALEEDERAGREGRAARRDARRQARQERRAALDAEIDAEIAAKAHKRRRRTEGDVGAETGIARAGAGAVAGAGAGAGTAVGGATAVAHRAAFDADETPTGPARLDIRSLVVDFGGLRAVDDVSIIVEPGTIAGLVGPNGSGKTTLLDTVSGQVTPTEGTLLLDGQDLVDFIPEERARLGMVRSFQDCRLYPELSVEDTLLLCEDARNRVDILSTTLQLPWARRSERDKRRAVDRVIGSFGLDRFRSHLTGHLSTGTRRVVDLASIVLASPRILLLDEPTAGIAQREAEAFIPLLRRLQEVTGSTILIVEHDVPLVFELCSTVVVMQSGAVVAAGPPEVVREDPRALAAYLGASDAALNVTGPARGPQAGSGLAGP